jgi:hypothetical protein
MFAQLCAFQRNDKLRALKESDCQEGLHWRDAVRNLSQKGIVSMTLAESDVNTLLVGRGETINRVPDTSLKAALAKIPELFAAKLAFMTPEHHLVRNFAVRELPYEHGRPIKVDRLAATLGLPIAKVHAIVEDLERHLFFLVRNEAGEISWAFPVTTDSTPHRLRFSTGERVHGA